MEPKEFRKVFPAANLPMLPDFGIDEQAYRQHLRWLMTFDIGGLVINGHAGELESLTPEERFKVAEIARSLMPKEMAMVVGVTGLCTREAVRCAKDAKAAGADGLLVMPIPHFAFGAIDYPKLIIPYFEELAKQVDLPMILFRYPKYTGLMYSVQVMLEVAQQVPQVVAIKDASLEYERAWVAFQDFSRKVNFLPAAGNLFLIRFLSADGAVSSFANVVPEYITQLFSLAHSGKKAEAAALFNKIRVVSNAIYQRVPSMQHWVVEKEALVARGRFPRAVARPPFQPVEQGLVNEIRAAIKSAGLQGV